MELMCLNAWTIGSDTLRWYGLIGVGVVLLEEVWLCWSRCVTVGVGFKTLILAAWKPVFS